LALTSDERTVGLVHRATTGARLVLWNPAENLDISQGKGGCHIYRVPPTMDSAVLPAPHAVLIAGPFFIARREQLVALAAGHAMPTIYPIAYFAECGGLMSYGPAAGTYTEGILKGAKPVDLPIEPKTKYELVINLKSAKALRLSVPPSLLARADKVIE
jgi:hypothetical protein